MSTVKKSSAKHPDYYNMHPKGIECITIIRHYQSDVAMAVKYLWRAGLKTEQGKTKLEKTLDDYEKCLDYINDWYHHLTDKEGACLLAMQQHTDSDVTRIISEVTGRVQADILKGFDGDVASAISALLHTGIICNGVVCTSVFTLDRVRDARFIVSNRIEDMYQQLMKERHAEVDACRARLNAEEPSLIVF